MLLTISVPDRLVQATQHRLHTQLLLDTSGRRNAVNTACPRQPRASYTTQALFTTTYSTPFQYQQRFHFTSESLCRSYRGRMTTTTTSCIISNPVTVICRLQKFFFDSPVLIAAGCSRCDTMRIVVYRQMVLASGGP